MRLIFSRMHKLLLAGILAAHTIEDVSVEDPPLEEVIAQVFAQSAESKIS